VQQRLNMTKLAAELRAQFEAFAAAFGRAPDFVDGHQHVHLFPQVRHAALEAVAWMAPQAWVRQCGSIQALSRRLGDPKGLLVDWLSREFRARAARHGIDTNPAFAGTYTYRLDTDFPRIFPQFLERMPRGGLVMCHPGHVDDELMRLDPLTLLREKEYAYFAGDAFPADLRLRQHFTCAPFRPGLARPISPPPETRAAGGRHDAAGTPDDGRTVQPPCQP
jgi:predicted glycoside hydrolase/deacetylase ChbG (UPF0249 family)